jgi:hypothetical protein
MFTITFTKDKEQMVFQTEKRSIARSCKLLEFENDMKVEVTEERQPKVIKFKGID